MTTPITLELTHDAHHTLKLLITEERLRLVGNIDFYKTALITAPDEQARRGTQFLIDQANTRLRELKETYRQL